MSENGTLRRGRPGYDQQGILDVAVAAFIQYGYDATSMGVLADRLGLSKSAIYHHFASKDEILDRALDTALGALEGVLEQADAAHGRAADRLDQVLRGAVHVLVDKLPYVTLLLRVRGNTEVERRALARRRAFDRRVTALVSEAQAEGSRLIRSSLRSVSRLLCASVAPAANSAATSNVDAINALIRTAYGRSFPRVAADRAGRGWWVRRHAGRRHCEA